MPIIIEIFKSALRARKNNDRENLEWLVYYCLISDVPPISTGRGKELLGFSDMQQMRDFIIKMSEKEYIRNHTPVIRKKVTENIDHEFVDIVDKHFWDII